MEKWFKKHYFAASLVFLLVVFAGWTAFLNVNNREVSADNGADKTTAEAVGTTGGADTSATPTLAGGDVVMTASDSGTESSASVSSTASGQDVTTDGGNPAGTTDEADVISDKKQPGTEISDLTESGTDAAGTGVDGSDGMSAEAGGDGEIPDEGNEVSETDEQSDVTDIVIPDILIEPTPGENETDAETQQLIDFNYAISDVSDFLKIRSGPGTEYDVIGRLGANAYAEVLERGEEWTKIRSGSVEGYASNGYLLFDDIAVSRVRQLNALMLKAVSSSVNIYTEDNSESEVIRQAEEGETFICTPGDSKTGWYSVTLSDGSKGYVTIDSVTLFINLKTAEPGA